jgi:glucuronoarabinoxylan endo-1,4-beta-xylanase
MMNRLYKQFAAICVVILFMIYNVQPDLFAATGKVNVRETHQTMDGFGASIAWYENTLANHPKKNDIYYYIFEELGLDILRLRNTYRNNAIGSAQQFSAIVQNMYSYSSEEPKLMISSWSPPSNLKSNNSVNGGNNATLKKNPTTGKYVYGEFAKYWIDALKAYKSIGIEPDFISIQNEPSYDASWESCRFVATETGSIAGYDRALDSVYYALKQANLTTKLVGPECHGIGYNTFQSYAQRYNHSHLAAYAYHLYHGESDNVNDNHNPDLFIPNLSTIARNYPGKPIWQTEFDRGDWLNTVWLMHNCLVHGNVSAYLYWSLVWGSGGKPLVEMQSSDFILTDYYWAFRQYSKFISAGWKRVTATVDAANLKISAFINPEGNQLTVVIVNVGTQNEQVSFDIQNFNITNGAIIRTSDIEEGDEINNNYDGKSAIEFPARSITTLAFSGQATGVRVEELSGPSEFLLCQNYPNPFNPSTVINYQLAVASQITLKVYDLLGRKVATLADAFQNAGEYSVVWDAKDDQHNSVASGIYLYRLETDGMNLQRKMILVR